MITKAEFYGQYLLSAGKADAAKPIGIYIERADAAWSVIEELQITGLPARVGECMSDEQISAAIDEFNDDAEEPKPGKWWKGRQPLADEQVEETPSFFTDEQKAEIKAIVNDGESK